MKNFSNLLNKNLELFTCIFITLFIQLFITYISVKLNNKYNIVENIIKYINSLFLLIIITIILIIILYTIPKIESLLGKQILFSIFSIFVGLIISLSLIDIDQDIIVNAIKSTLINFIIIFIFGLIVGYFGIDLSWLGLILFISLIIIITVSIVNQIVIYNKNKDNIIINKYMSIIIIVIFSIYILYDTNNILLRYKNNSNNCVNGALDYYLDIWNLFTSYLNLSK